MKVGELAEDHLRSKIGSTLQSIDSDSAGGSLSEESFRECYERLTDDELSQIVDMRKDLMPEAAAALDHEVERRHFKPESSSWAKNPKTFGLVAGLIILPLVISLDNPSLPFEIDPILIDQFRVCHRQPGSNSKNGLLPDRPLSRHYFTSFDGPSISSRG
jgi:hypothetical protein